MGETKKRVKMNNLGPGRGQTVHFSDGQLKDAGVDPNAALEANRYVFPDGRAEIRVRIYPAESDD